jgi:hypothetical protein
MRQWEDGANPFSWDFASLDILSRGCGGIPIKSRSSCTPLKKACTKNYVPNFARYMCEESCILLCDLLILVSSLSSKFGDF